MAGVVHLPTVAAATAAWDWYASLVRAMQDDFALRAQKVFADIPVALPPVQS